MDTEAARAIVDANSYMTLATADADGAPWASPVWFAHEQYETFLWMSRPGARHSRNIAARREIAIVIFDSTVSPQQRNAVYVEAAAAIVPDAELADAVAVYAARSVAAGWRRWHAKKSAATRPGVCIAPTHPRCTYSRTSTIAASPCSSRVDHPSAVVWVGATRQAPRRSRRGRRSSFRCYTITDGAEPLPHPDLSVHGHQPRWEHAAPARHPNAITAESARTGCR